MTRGGFAAPGAPEVALYTRPGCHLCEVAAHQLRALAMSVPLRLVEVDIEGDPELERRYLLEIPVIAVDGEVVAQAPIDLEVVRRAVLAASRAR